MLKKKRMPKTAVISEQGRREEMENTYFLDLNFANNGWVFGGVYDGHGGKYAAEYAAANLHQRFLTELLSGLSPQEAFVASYQRISQELEEQEQESGTVAVSFLIKDNRINCIAN